MLRSITVGGKAVPKANDYGASLTFTDNAYNVDDGCNTGGGSVGYLKDAVVLSAGSQTAAACQDRQAVTETQKYGGRFDVKVSGTMLTLTSSDRVYVFDAQGHAAFASQLVGTTWHLDSWSFNRASHAVRADNIKLSYLDDIGRSVQLDDGCNKLANGETFNAATLRLDSSADPRRLTCPHQNVALWEALPAPDRCGRGRDGHARSADAQWCGCGVAVGVFRRGRSHPVAQRRTHRCAAGRTAGHDLAARHRRRAWGGSVRSLGCTRRLGDPGLRQADVGCLGHLQRPHGLAAVRERHGGRRQLVDGARREQCCRL
jgi:heat shock protein HslJ